MATRLAENEVRGYLAVLEEALQHCWDMLKQRGAQEGDLRDGLSLLKFTHADAKRVFLGSERLEWMALSSATISMVTTLLAPLKGFNPQLDNWERARDPQIPVQDLGL